MDHKEIVFDNVLSSAELGLTGAERASLIEVRDMFVKYAKVDHFVRSGVYDDVQTNLMNGRQFDGFGLFNMGYGCARADPNELKEHKEDQRPDYSCGTSACIAGWMKLQERGKVVEGKETIVSAKVQDYVDSWVMAHQGENNGLSKLFFPHEVDNWDKITLDHAVVAIDGFLYTGKPDWSLAKEEIN